MRVLLIITLGLLTLVGCEVQYGFSSQPVETGTLARSSEADWIMARMAYIRNHPECEACGARDELSVHHIVPRESGGSNEPENLITLCDPNDKGMDRTLGCHWIVGHGAAGWAKSNPHRRKQAAALLKRAKANVTGGAL